MHRPPRIRLLVVGALGAVAAGVYLEHKLGLASRFVPTKAPPSSEHREVVVRVDDAPSIRLERLSTGNPEVPVTLGTVLGGGSTLPVEQVEQMQALFTILRDRH